VADDTRQANVVLTADTNQYSQQMATAATSTSAAADSVNKLFAALERLQRVTARRLEIISASAFAGIGAATMAAAKFEQQMGQLQASAAITGKSIGTINKAVNDLRTNLPVSTEQVIQLVGALQKMGASQHNIEALAKTFIQLGAATGEDIGALATNLTSLQRSMGTTEAATKSFADQTAHLSATLGVSATGILQFANNLAPVARTVGMTQTQVMGFAGAFVKAGQDGYAASTVFTKLVTDISRATRYGSNDIYAYANAVGMTADQFKKLPAAEQATQFFNAISRQGADSIKTLERLGYDGPRALKAIQGLAQSGGLNRSMNEAQAGLSSDATKKGAAAAMDGLNDSLKKLQNTLTSIAQTFGATFLPIVTSVVDGVTKLTQVVSNAMKPFTALLGVLGMAGGATSGVLGMGVSSFGMLSTAAAAYALLRNPLTAGFRAARATRTGNMPSAFVRNTSESIAAGGGTPWQRRFFGWGARGANLIPTGGPEMGPMTAAQSMRASAMGMVGGGIRGLPGRLATGFAGLYSGAMGLAQSQLEPLQMRAINDATKRPGDAFRESKASWAAFKSGEAAYGASVKAVASSTARLGSSILSATGGIAKLGVAAARAGMGGSIMGGIGSGLAKGGSAVMGALGGPVGLAMIGGFAAFSAISGLRQKEQEFRERLADPNAPDSAVNKYATAMGLAGSAAMSFADTVNKASKTIDVDSVARAQRVQGEDIKLGTAYGRKMTDESLDKMSVTQATQYAASTFAGNADPNVMQAMKLDLIDKFGADQARAIIGSASAGQGMSVGNILDKTQMTGKIIGPNANRDLLTSFRPSKALKDQLSQAESTFSNTAGYISSQYGEREAGRYTVAQVNSILGQITSRSSTSQANAALDTIQSMIGEGDLNLNAGAIMTAKTPEAKQKALKDQIFNQAFTGTGAGKDYFSALNGLSAQDQAATSYNMLPVGDNTLYAQLGVYRSNAGKMLAKGAGGALGGQINQALRSPDDANAQLTAATNWADQLTTLTGSTTLASAELQQLKARINDTSDPLYQMAQAAQQAAQRIQGYAAAYQDRGQNARTTAGKLATSYVSLGPDRQQNIIAAEDAYEGARSGLYEQFKNIVKSYREFDIQQGRGLDNFNKQRARSDEDYARQRKYGEDDYWLSKNRQQASFDKQRARGEEDHQHQIDQQIRQNAKTMQDTYSRITTKPTWDAQNLLTNSNDQLARMRQQQQDLATVRAQGLSSDAINQLGLNEFGNQQQLARMVGDLANNPELIKQWNDAVAGKLDISKAFVTDQDSESWKETERQYQLSLDRMSEDFKLMNDQGEADYKKTLDRQNQAYAQSMKRTGDDFRLQMAQAREDLNRSFEEVTGDFNTMANEALSRLTGVTASQYTELNTALGKSREEIKTAMSGTTEDMIKLLAPLFGGEDAARKALASATTTDQHLAGGQMSAHSSSGATGTTHGGGYGSEQSYDSMSGGGGIGGMSGANFPLPSGSWVKTSNFGMRMNPVLHKMMLHAGTDLGAKAGTPIGAAEDGVVTKAQAMGGLGNMVEVSHGDGTKTWYGHMSMITAKKGDLVSAGTQIGLVGSTGNSTGNHLHFERHINGQAVDPWGYLQGLASGSIQASPWGSGAFAGIAGPGGGAKSVTGMQSVMDVEKAFGSMVPGGMAYTPGLFPNALQTRINQLTGDVPMDTGGDYLPSYFGGTSVRQGGGNYVRGGTTMSTQSVTTIAHIDNGTDYNGGIVVVAQDPDEMGRKLAEKKRMKALVRPSRSN
jgi:TP901 family phage tail tape measure protein